MLYINWANYQQLVWTFINIKQMNIHVLVSVKYE